METTAISAKALTKTFGQLTAVNGIDMTVQRGEVVALLGPNGAGKSTTIDMIMGLTTPASGTLSVSGLAPAEAVRRGIIAAMLQSGAMLQDQKVGSMLSLAAHMNRVPDRLPLLVDQLEAGRLMDRKVRACSGGERQVVRLIMALLPDPDILILDEPTAGLDPTARAAFWHSMGRQTQQGKTVVFATHYLEEAEQFAKRTIIMNRGQIVADGPTAVIRQQTAQQRLTAVIPPERQNDVAALVTDIVPDAQMSFDSGVLTVTGRDLRNLASRLMVDNTLSGIELTNASLNDTFAALTESI